MTRFLDAWSDATDNFWDLFPYMRRVPAFKKLYTTDRSEKKHKSSKCMWFLTLSYDLDSDFYDYDALERLMTLEEVCMLNCPGYMGDDYTSICDGFVDHIDTALSASVRSLEVKLKERTAFMTSTPYRLDEYVQPHIVKIIDGEEVQVPDGKPRLVKGTAKDLDTMFASTKSIQDLLMELRDNMKSKDKSENFGGTQDSLMESRG